MKENSSKSPNEVKQEIASVDRQLVALLDQRLRLARNIQNLKDDLGKVGSVKPDLDNLLHAVQQGQKLGLDGRFVAKVFKDIVDYSFRTQRAALLADGYKEKGSPIVRIAYFGTEGSYSHMAAKQGFAPIGEQLAFFACKSFSDVIDTVESDKADFAVLPIENTTAGGINEVYALLRNTRLYVVGEEKIEIDHCVGAVSDIPLVKISKIYSHAQALAQCSQFLANLNDCEVVTLGNTAEAVERVKKENDPHVAAIASEETVESRGLLILQRDISNQKTNFTRFFVLGAKPVSVDLSMLAKTSIVLATAHKEGALARCLNILAVAKLNLTKIESRPRPNSPWEYLFYLDFEGNIADDKTSATIEQLKNEATFLKVLGSYPILETKKPENVPVPFVSRLLEGPKTALGPSPGKKASGYRLVTRDHKNENTIINIQHVRIGGGDFVVIAGPCAVEDEEGIRLCARAVREAGAHILRGGCFKPRTSPYSFQGLGFQGLEILSRAGEDFGLPIVTEVLSPRDVGKVSRQADVLQIGARNMQNFSLLSEVGRMDRPVLLKRGLMSSVEELLSAAEYVLAEGNQQVILCERGIRTFETSTRNTLDLSAVPILKQRTHLPVVVDPSHAAGARYLVPSLSKAAKAVGADGIMIEIHQDPDSALSDGPQSLGFREFAELMKELSSAT